MTPLRRKLFTTRLVALVVTIVAACLDCFGGYYLPGACFAVSACLWFSILLTDTR